MIKEPVCWFRPGKTLKFSKLRFPFYIAWRYLLAKKTHNAINIITLVSMIGIGVGAMALVVILSVTNGLEKLIITQFNAFHADIEITPAKGKTIKISHFPLEEVNSVQGVLRSGAVLEESGMVRYRDRQHLVRLKGVDSMYHKITGIDTLLVEGIYEVEQNDRNMLVLGNGVASILNASIHDLLHPIEIFVPARGRTAGLTPAQAFRTSSNHASGIFAVHAEVDAEYVLLPIRLMRRLLEYDDEVSSIMIDVEEGFRLSTVQRRISEIAGPGFVIRTRMQQQEFLYKVMRSEKWAIFFILTFILMIAAFNIVGSLTMLVLEKRKDISVLRSMGASRKLIERIFLLEGVLISMGGALGGILLGGLVSWLQMRYGIIGIQAEGSFIIDAYPVVVKTFDLVLVAFTVFSIGLLASLLPLTNMWKSMDKAPG